MASINDVIPITPYDGIMDGNNPYGLVQTIQSLTLHDFGHSLSHYTGGDVAPWNQFTSAMNWLGYHSQDAGKYYHAGGNFGNVQTVNNTWDINGGPPTESSINLTTVPTYWLSGTFDQVGATDIIFMASNFEQEDQTPNQYLAGTLGFFDKVSAIYPNARYHMYVHWPEASMLVNAGISFVDDTNLTPAEFTQYNNYLVTDYWTWHTDWFNLITAARPNLDIRVLPLGCQIASLIENESYMSTVSYTDFYGDSSGHGTETTYFLSAVCMFQSMYEDRIDFTGYTLPVGAAAFPPEIGSNLTSVETYLNTIRSTFVDANGIPL